MREPSNPRRNQILSTGKELFWKFGFKRVTIEEICREAGVSKMTFYKFFSNKLELAKTIMDNLIDESMMNFKAIQKEDLSPSEKMQKILQLKLQGSNDISQEFIQDLYANSDPDLGLTQHIEAKTKIVWKELIEVFRKGQEDGWVRKDLNLEFLFAFMQTSIGLISDPGIQKLFKTPQDLIMEVTNLFIYGITPHE